MSRWYFPPNSGGETQGLNEPGISIFKETDSLARETVQNILDNPDGSGLPRVVEFELLDLHHENFPGWSTFLRTFMACRTEMRHLVCSDSGDDERFFQIGENLLNAHSGVIPTLRIRDINTTGLVGEDHEEHMPFCRLLRVQGVSTGQGPGGGTYGIGQRAPFHCSALRTVLYYTRRASDRVEAFIGKSILCTHKSPDPPHDRRQAKGWWCNVDASQPDDWKAIRDPGRIPPVYRRTEPGTDLYITGFVLYDDWARVIRDAVLKNFFAAIYRGQLEVRLLERGKVLVDITRESLHPVILSAISDQPQDDVDSARESLSATAGFLEALRAPVKGHPFRTWIRGLGEVEFYVHRDPYDSTLPDRWAYMRSPLMLVGTREARVIRRYAGVLLCDDSDGNRYLARLEGPQHREWEPSEWRNATPEERRDAERIMRALGSFVRDRLRSLMPGSDSSVLNPPFLGHYLPDVDLEPDGFDSTPGTGAEARGTPVNVELADRALPVVRPTEVARRRTVYRPPALQSIASLPEGGLGGPGPLGDNGSSEHGDVGRGGAGASGDDGPGDEGARPLVDRKLIRCRTYVQHGQSVLILKAHADVEGDLRLVALGESGPPQRIRIIRATGPDGIGLSASGDRLRGIRLRGGDSLRVVLDLDTGPRVCLAVGE